MNRFLANHRRHEQAEKRGGGAGALSFDAVETEQHCRVEPAHEDSPNRAFERHWALTLLAHARSRLQEDCERTGKHRLFRELAGMLVSERVASYAEIAARLGISEGAVKMAVQRLRERYQALLREEIAQTVGRPEEVEEELHWLFAALATSHSHFITTPNPE